MSSSNQWFGKLVSRAKSVQEQAKNGIEKLSVTLDKKIKEAQEDLEKQRSLEVVTPQLHWRPSTENPDGEIIPVTKPPPIDQSVIQASSESPPTLPPPVESITVRHKGKRRLAKTTSHISASSASVDTETDSTNEQKTNSIKRNNNNREEIVFCLNDIINQIIDREIMDKCSNQLIDKISTVDELAKNTTLNEMSQKEESISVQDSSNHFEDNIDKEKEESISSKTELYQENIQMDISTDKLTSMTNIDNLPIEHSDSKSIPINLQDDELPALTNIDDLSITHSGPENIPKNNTSNDELSTTTNITDSPILSSRPESIQINIADDEPPTTTNIDDLSITHSDPENIPIKNTSDDELPTTTNIADSPILSSRSESIPINIADDEPPTITNIDDLSIAHSDPENIPIKNTSDDELPTTTNIDDTPIINSRPENILIKDTSDDELPTTTNIDNLSVQHSGPENISIDTSDDELPATTNIADSPILSSRPESIPINIPDDEPPKLKNIDNSPNTHFAPENIQMKIPDDKLPTLTNIEDSPIKYSGPEDTSINILNGELSTSMNVDEISTSHPNSENISTNISDDESPTAMNTDDTPIINSNPENSPINVSDDDNDEVSTLKNIDDLPMVVSGSKNIQMKIPDDKLTELTSFDEMLISHPDPRNIPISMADDELPVLKNIIDTPIEQSESKDEVTILDDVVKSKIKYSNSNENHSMISETNTKTPPNELEDSFEELKMPNIPVHRPPEEPSQKLTHLAALRQFISKIEDDVDEEEEVVPPKQNINILESNVHTKPEQIHPSNIIQNTLSSSLTSISDDTPENLINETPPQSNSLSDEPFMDERNESISAMSMETKLVEKKRFSVVNCHTIPVGTKICHINCSSTYIYICTTDRKLFYAKLNLNDINYPFKWQQHSDLADQLVVSVTNRTVWRLFNKHLYKANDPIKFPPLGSQWNEMKINNGQSLLSMSINDQCGWYIKKDGTLWLMRTDDETYEPLSVTCPFTLNTVFCFSEKVGVATNDGEILIRVGCTNDCPEGDGWIFIEHNFGPIDDFILLTNNNIITILDKKHHLWIHQWSSDKGFYEILCNDEFLMSHQRYLITVNSELLCLTDCDEQIHIFSDSLTGIQWTVIQQNTRLQRLIGAFSNEDYVWALTTDKMISSSNGQILEKPRQAQYLTHATFVPDDSSQGTILWSLDESCNIYVRANVENDTHWEQVDQSQFEWNRRLVHIVCNNNGVWAVDDQGCIHFRHGHMAASQNFDSDEISFLPPAWIRIPGEAERRRCFSQIYCGPADWMVYATDNKQNVYTREGINEENPVGTSWKVIEDCSALELAITEYTLWLLTSCGHVQCRENISLANPIGTRSTTLPGFFLSLAVSMDDSQVWALDSKRNLLKLDRLTVLFEK